MMEQVGVGEGRIAIMQPYFFPYIGYWQLIAAVDKFVIYDDGHYIKRGWMHRNHILGYDNASRMPINCHVQHASYHKLIYEMEREPGLDGPSATLKTIAHRYQKAPHYKEVMELLTPLILNDETALVPYLSRQIMAVADYLGIDTEFHFSTEVDKTGLEGVLARTVRMCDHFGIHNYVNPIGGTEFYDKDEWLAAGLNLNFLKRCPDICYKQFGSGFVPDLSIIDVMMFCSVSEIRDILQMYTIL